MVKKSKSKSKKPAGNDRWQADDKGNNVSVVLENVRFSFTGNGKYFFEPEDFKKSSKYKGTFIVEDEDQIALVDEIIDFLKEEHIDGGDPENCCWREGNEHVSKKTGEIYDGFEGNMYIVANRSEKLGPPEVFAADEDQIEEYPDKRIFKDGCYGNAMLRFFYSEEWDTIGCTIEAVLYTEEGEPFAAETSVSKSPEQKKKLFGGFKPETKKSDKVFAGKGRRKRDEEPEDDDNDEDEEEEDNKSSKSSKRRGFGRR